MPDERAEAHLKETKKQMSRLERALASLDEKIRRAHCGGMAGILLEGKAIMEEDCDDTTMDARLIASAQRIEHYEMAAYGTTMVSAARPGR